MTAEPIYGLPSAGAVLSRFRAALIAYGVSNLWLCDDAPSASSLADYKGGVPLAITSASPGAPPIVSGDFHSFSFASGQYAKAAGTYVYPGVFTTGVVVNLVSYGGGNNDCCLLGAWNSAGSMLYTSLAPAIRFYMGGSDVGAAVDIRGLGRQFICATYDGTQVRLYRNGVLVAGPTTIAYSNSTTSMMINRYTTTTCTATGRVSDGFVIPSVLTAAQLAALNALIG